MDQVVVGFCVVIVDSKRLASIVVDWDSRSENARGIKNES